MKSLTHVLLLASLLGSVGAQDYQVAWFTVAGGAGTSSNGPYSVSDTIGQSSVGGAMAGAPYSVTGGFWSAASVPSVPVLTMTALTPDAASLHWTPETGDYVLQVTGSLSPAHWVNAPSGSANHVVVPFTSSVRFYRVYKP
jgi:hypothetical protein